MVSFRNDTQTYLVSGQTHYACSTLDFEILQHVFCTNGEVFQLAVVLVMTPSFVAVVYRRFGRPFCLHLSILISKAKFSVSSEP
jgi:hypothetical protein